MASGKDDEIFEYLVNKGNDLKQTDEYGYTFLHLAARNKERNCGI